MRPLVTALLALAFAACNPNLEFTHNEKDVEKEIFDSFEKQTGVETKEIDCPSKLPPGKHKCQAITASGERIDIELELNGKNSEWHTVGVAFATSFEPAMISAFRKQGIDTLVPKCPRFVRIAIGKSFVCPATVAGNAASVRVTAKAKDADGVINWGFVIEEPGKTPAAPAP